MRSFLAWLKRGAPRREVANDAGPEILPPQMEPKDDSYPTRASLLARLKDPEDHRSWEEFQGLYGPLIRGFALKAGLTESEAEDVVQKTLAAVARHLPDFRYDPARCSFKTWLLNLSRWRVTDQLRKRLPLGSRPASADGSDEGTRTATIERVADPAGGELERLWDREWETALLPKALARVKERVNLKAWQIFDLYVLKEWAPRDVAKALGVSTARVYLTKHRIASLVRKELKKLDQALV